MTAPLSRLFALTDEAAWQRFVDALARRYRVVGGKTLSLRLAYLDTFDWRVWRDGGVMEYRHGGERNRLQWRDIGRLDIRAEFPLAQCPAFVDDIPEWLSPPPLARIVRPRRLLVQSRSRAEVAGYEIMNDASKVVARAHRVTEVLHTANGRAGPSLPERLEVRPARGHADAFDGIAAAGRQAGLADYGMDPLARLLRLRGKKPADYSLRLGVKVDRRQRADWVSKQLLSRSLDIARANEAGARDDTDIVFLRDFRYALGRALSLVGRLENIFNRDIRERLQADLSWLRRETDALYMLNDWLADFRDARALGKKQQERLSPLLAHLRQRRQTEYAKVAALLRGKRHAALGERWRAFLTAEADDGPAPKHAAAPIIDVAGMQLWKSYKALLRFTGKELDAPPHLEQLADASRALGDMLEFCRVLRVADGLQPRREAADRLRQNANDCLGATRKLAELRAFLAAAGKENPLQKKSAKAMDKMAARLERERRAAAEQLIAPYRELTDDTARRSFKAVFKAANVDNAAADRRV